MKARIVRYMLYVVMLCMVACGSQPTYPETIRSEPPPLPSYPQMLHAPNVTQRPPENKANMARQLITFQTTDPPEGVRAFYIKQLLAQGWTQANEDEQVLIFGNTVACPYFALTIQTTRVLPTLTKVELDFRPLECLRSVE